MGLVRGGGDRRLDRQYGIELSAADAERLTSVREIRAVLAERGVIV